MIVKLNLPRDTGQYLVAKPNTFRLSCRKVLSSTRDTEYNNFGGNRQNVEKEMKTIYIADDGYSFFQPDQGGADAMIVASLCRPGKYRQLFANGIKPHTYMALVLFAAKWKEYFNPEHIDIALGTDISQLKALPFWKELDKLIRSSDEWEASKRYYFIAKKVIHASSYGMRGNRLRQVLVTESLGTIVISLKEAEEYIQKFHQTFPEIKDWHMRLYQETVKSNVIRNIMGFPYNVTEPVRFDDMKDLIAWAPQSSVACINREAFIQMQEYIEDNNKDWHLLADTHDSIMGEAPDNEVQEAGEILRGFLMYEWNSQFDGTKFKMRSSLAIGKNWSPYHPDKNPLGLKEAA